MTTALDWFDIGGCRASYTILFVKPFRIPMNLETFSHLVTLTMAVCTGESGSIPKSLGRSCNNLQQHVSFNGEADPFCFHSVSTLGDVLVLFLSDHREYTWLSGGRGSSPVIVERILLKRGRSSPNRNVCTRSSSCTFMMSASALQVHTLLVL